jgi:tetratricopeptide (TPR) repeat protein
VGIRLPPPDVQVVILFAAAFAIQFGYRCVKKQGRRARAIRGFLGAYRRGDFAGALALIERLRNDPPLYCYYRGALFAELGRLNEAEELLRQAIPLRERAVKPGGGLTKDAKQLALSWSTLGELLRTRRRFAAAKRCFDTSLQIWPQRGETHRELAEAWLHEGADVAQGLKWAKLAVEEDRGSLQATQELYVTKLGEDLSVLAWATALNTPGDTAQVERLIAEAVSTVGTSAVTSRARVLYYSGLAQAALGDRDRSAKYFADAAKVDLHGRWGRAARAAANAA